MIQQCLTGMRLQCHFDHTKTMSIHIFSFQDVRHPHLAPTIHHPPNLSGCDQVHPVPPQAAHLAWRAYCKWQQRATLADNKTILRKIENFYILWLQFERYGHKNLLKSLDQKKQAVSRALRRSSWEAGWWMVKTAIGALVEIRRKYETCDINPWYQPTSPLKLIYNTISNTNNNQL